MSNISKQDDMYTHVLKSQSSTKALILFHGFPCTDPITKNHDIANIAHEQLDIDTYLLHYPGLGDSKGLFSFQQSIDDSIQFAKEIAQNSKYDEIFILGHSWGGLIALNVCSILQEKIKKIILLSPYMYLPPDKELSINLKKEIEANPNILLPENFSSILAELQFVRKYRNPQDIIKNQVMKSYDTAIIQAKNDDVVPRELTKSLLTKFEKKPQYIELSTNHSFTQDRNKVINILVQFLEGDKIA